MSEAKKWAVRVGEFWESKKSQRVWCAEQGIKRSSLRYWLERLAELESGSEVSFAEIAADGESR